MSLPAAEEMTLLSRIIKSSQAIQDGNKGISIQIRPFRMPVNEHEEESTSSHFPNQALIQAEEEAEALVSKAKQHAEAISLEIRQERERWEEERAILAEQAQKEGYQQGVEDGLQKGYGEAKDEIAFAKEIVEASKKDYQEHIESSEAVILELALNVAGKIINQKLEEDEGTFLSIVKRAIKETRDNREVQLHIHPSRYPFLLSNKEELMSIFPKDTDLYIYPDEALQENSCLIESENGRIDASVDSQLAEIKAKLTEMLEGE